MEWASVALLGQQDRGLLTTHARYATNPGTEDAFSLTQVILVALMSQTTTRQFAEMLALVACVRACACMYEQDSTWVRAVHSAPIRSTHLHGLEGGADS